MVGTKLKRLNFKLKNRGLPKICEAPDFFKYTIKYTILGIVNKISLSR